jgi:hypothetical protein
MKECLQKLMDQGLVQIGYSRKEDTIAMVDQHEHEKVVKPIEIVYQKAERTVEPLVIQAPSPFPFASTKAVPWNYDTSAFVQGKLMTVVEPFVINIDGTGRMTRSGRVFAPKSLQENVEVLATPANKHYKKISTSRRLKLQFATVQSVTIAHLRRLSNR